MSAILQSSPHQLSDLVERQMRNWEFAQAQQPAGSSPRMQGVHDFVSISRRPGAGGAEVASLLGERLHWPVFDRELLHAMAGDDAIRERLYESMDERDLSWLEEVLRSLMRSEFPRNDYFHRLTRTVLSIARKGEAVFLGRATDLILPCGAGLRVRLTAPIEHCIQQLVSRRSIAPEQARAEIQRVELERAQFVENHFEVDSREECRHDLIINTQQFGPKESVGMILSAISIRGMLR